MPKRLEIASKMGADRAINGREENLEEVIMKETNGAGVGKILECSGVGPMLTGCMKYLRKGGLVGLIGLPKGDIIFKDPIWGFVFKSLTIKTVHGRRIFHTVKLKANYTNLKSTRCDKVAVMQRNK